MIVIFSYAGDSNTIKLIDWLTYLSCPYIRINLKDEDFRNIELYSTNKHIDIRFRTKKNLIINFREVNFFYVRGVGFKKRYAKNTTDLPDSVFNYYIDKEYNSLVNFFYDRVNEKAIGAFQNNSTSKLNQLNISKKKLI